MSLFVSWQRLLDSGTASTLEGKAVKLHKGKRNSDPNNKKLDFQVDAS